MDALNTLEDFIRKLEVNNWQDVISEIETNAENFRKAILKDKSKCDVELAEQEREVNECQFYIEQCLDERKMVYTELKPEKRIDYDIEADSEDMCIWQLFPTLRDSIYRAEINRIVNDQLEIEAEKESFKLDVEHIKIVQCKLEAFERLIDIVTGPIGDQRLRIVIDETLRTETYPGVSNTEDLNQELDDIIYNLMCHKNSVSNDNVLQKTFLTEAIQIAERLKAEIETNYKPFLSEHNLKICKERDELIHLCMVSRRQMYELHHKFGTYMISCVLKGLDNEHEQLKQLTIVVKDLNKTPNVNTLNIFSRNREIYRGRGVDKFHSQTANEKDPGYGDQGTRDIEQFDKELQNATQMRETLSENVNQMKERLIADHSVLIGVLNQMKKSISVADSMANCLKQPFGEKSTSDQQSKHNPVQLEVLYDRKESAIDQQLPISDSLSLLDTTDIREGGQKQVELKYAEIKYSKIECDIKRFIIMKSTCETVKGVLTICKQDFSNASALIGNHAKTVVSSTFVHVFTTDEFRHDFEEGLNVMRRNMSAHDVLEEIKQYSGFSLIVINWSDQETISESLKNSDIRDVGVLIVGNPVTEFPLIPNVFFKQTNSCSVMEADGLLQRCAMTILEAIYESLKRYESHREADIVTEREKIQLYNMYNLIAACYKRSTIRSSEWPDFPTEIFEYPPKIDEAIACIVKNPGIIGCVKKRGMLYIYIDESTTHADADINIRSSLKEHKVTKFMFLRRTKRDFYSSGDSVFDRRGTLGGFVKMENLPTASIKIHASQPASGAAANLSIPSHTLVALVSRHVAQGSEYLTVGQTRIGRIDTFAAIESIDILPVKVFDECIANCETTFKSEFGVTMRVAKLTKTDDIQDLVGFPVHIWSDRSAPGLGILVEHDMIHRNGIRIIIRDRDEETPFSLDGDSGAMVCCTDPRGGNTLFAVAMIVGEMTEGNENTREYTAQILDDALQKLGLWNDCRFLFIKEGR